MFIQTKKLTFLSCPTLSGGGGSPAALAAAAACAAALEAARDIRCSCLEEDNDWARLTTGGMSNLGGIPPPDIEIGMPEPGRPGIEPGGPPPGN